MTCGPQLVSVAVWALIRIAEQQVSQVQSTVHLERTKKTDLWVSESRCSCVSHWAHRGEAASVCSGPCVRTVLDQCLHTHTHTHTNTLTLSAVRVIIPILITAQTVINNKPQLFNLETAGKKNAAQFMSSLSPTSGTLCCKEPSWYAISCCWIPPNPADDYPIQCLSENWHNQSAIRRLPHRLVTQSWLADVLEWPLMSSWQSGLALHVVSHSFFIGLHKVERSALKKKIISTFQHNGRLKI